jgi:hypothetical protein
MKNKLILGMLMFALIAVSGTVYASLPAAKKQASEISRPTNYIINLGDLSQYTPEQIEKEIENVLALIDDRSELTCSVTVTGTVSVVWVEFEVSVTVSGPCSEVKAKGKQIALQILDDLKKEIKAFF